MSGSVLSFLDDWTKIAFFIAVAGVLLLLIYFLPALVGRTGTRRLTIRGLTFYIPSCGDYSSIYTRNDGEYEEGKNYGGRLRYREPRPRS